MYACNYPIMHSFSVSGSVNDPISYSILYNNATIYNGQVFPKSGDDTTVSVDISLVCREYLETYYENIDLLNSGLVGVPVVDNHTTIGVFTVSSEDNPGSSDVPYMVMYNYNSDYIGEYPNAMNINAPIYKNVDPRQIIPICGYAYGSGDSYSYQVNDNPAVSTSVTSNVFHILPLNLESLNLSAGDKITVTNNGESFTYNVVLPCKNRYALYYVNELGGLDTLLCDGNAVPGLSNNPTDVRLYNDRLNRRDFEDTRIYNEIDRRYTLRLNGIRDEGSRLLKHLFGSPKLWIHDLEAGTITACIMESTSISEQNFRANKIYNYEITIIESQKLIRK